MPGDDDGGGDGGGTPGLGPGASLEGWRPFPADNPWNQDVSGEPVDPNSAALIAACGAEHGRDTTNRVKSALADQQTGRRLIRLSRRLPFRYQPRSA